MQGPLAFGGGWIVVGQWGAQGSGQGYLPLTILHTSPEQILASALPPLQEPKRQALPVSDTAGDGATPTTAELRSLQLPYTSLCELCFLLRLRAGRHSQTSSPSNP